MDVWWFVYMIIGCLIPNNEVKYSLASKLPADILPVTNTKHLSAVLSL